MDRSSLWGSAWGKVILLGEHAVVYGVPAIAVGIDRGARAKSAPLPHGPSRLLVEDWNIEVTEDDVDRDLGRAFRALLEATRRDGAATLHPVQVEARADLPPGGGLGCSAALGVAIARALDGHATSKVAAARAMAWEQIFHGNPSGIDASVAAAGGCVFFEKGRSMESVRLQGCLTLCIGHSGTASSTKSMVESVARQKARHPEIVEKTFSGVLSLVRSARQAIESHDRVALGRLMDLNQMLLSGLFLSTPEIDQMCALARDAGAYGAKLTGAGGGGSVVSLVNGVAVADRVLAAWRGAGFEGFATRVSGHDVESGLLTESAP